MTLTASDVASLKSALDWWELAEYASTGIVFIGCLGEFFAEFTAFPKSEHRKHKLARLSLILVIAGIAGELLATVKSSELSGQIIAYVEANASDAKTSADNAAHAAERASASAQRADELSSNAASSAGRASTLARGARQEADSFERDIVSAKQQAASAESHLANALQRAASAEKEAAQASLDLEKFKAPRTLTDEQAKDIAEKVRMFSGQDFEVVTYWDSKEPLEIGQRIADILVGLAGWKLQELKEWQGLLPGTSGIFVVDHPKSDEVAKEAAAALVSALNSEGIHASVRQANDQRPINKLTIDVGQKP